MDSFADDIRILFIVIIRNYSGIALTVHFQPSPPPPSVKSNTAIPISATTYPPANQQGDSDSSDAAHCGTHTQRPLSPPLQVNNNQEHAALTSLIARLQHDECAVCGVLWPWVSLDPDVTERQEYSQGQKPDQPFHRDRENHEYSQDSTGCNYYTILFGRLPRPSEEWTWQYLDDTARDVLLGGRRRGGRAHDAHDAYDHDSLLDKIWEDWATTAGDLEDEDEVEDGVRHQQDFSESSTTHNIIQQDKNDDQHQLLLHHGEVIARHLSIDEKELMRIAAMKMVVHTLADPVQERIYRSKVVQLPDHS